MNNYKTMKELPESERPYEKALKHGAEFLTDCELLAVIIRCGWDGETGLDLAHHVLEFGPDGLLNLVYFSAEELKQIRGIGKVKAVQLKCIAELARRIANQCRHELVRLDDPETVAAYFMEDLRHLNRELLVVACFDSKCHLLGREVISIGTSNASLAAPSEVFRVALEYRADYIVLLHNHPSGDPSPSNEDVATTRRMQECGELLGIPLSDHIIIGDNCFYSFFEQN